MRLRTWLEQKKRSHEHLASPLGDRVVGGSQPAAVAMAAEPAPKLAARQHADGHVPGDAAHVGQPAGSQRVGADDDGLLPSNYDPGRKHPLLIFLNGGSGGSGGSVSVARKLCEEKDFVCLGVPLFKQKVDPPPSDRSEQLFIRGPDCKFAWPLYRRMLAKLDELVPNIDSAHRILGGLSNGGHVTAGLIDESDGEVVRLFSAFFFVQGGGRLKRYDLLKGKVVLMVYGSEKSRPRVQQICDAAKAAGQSQLFWHEYRRAYLPRVPVPGREDRPRGPALRSSIRDLGENNLVKF